MEIVHVKLDRIALAAMPASERVLLLLLAYASNEINVILKLILMTRKEEPSSPIVDQVEGGQAFIFMRLLIGKLHEAWELFKTRVQADRTIADKFIPKLSIEGTAALQELNRHFGQGSPLTAIRNKISFHFKDEDNLTEANFQQLQSSEPLQFYLSRTNGNSFYHVGELIAQLSAINLMKPPPPNPNDNRPEAAQAFDALCTEITSVSGNITELFGQLIAFLSESAAEEAITQQVPDGPKISTFSLPYFFDEVDTLPVPARPTKA